ncbi:MAG: zinc ribbon domain-containing protein, partial [Hyphomicrobiales bacterium]
MPTYEYVCNACGHRFEKFQSISAEPIKACPSCGKDEAQRQISGGAGFIFKGGGFYETDYRSEGYKKAAEADKAPSGDAKPAAAESKPAETKAAESKPAPKA